MKRMFVRSLRTSRVACLAILSPLAVFQIGGCFSQDVLFGALSQSLALVVANAAQGLLSGVLAGAG